MSELTTGDAAPDFELPRDGGETVHLDALKGQNVGFQVCNNTLKGRKISYEDDLYEYEDEARSLDEDTLHALKVKLGLEEMSDVEFVMLIEKLELEDEE